MRDLVEQAQAMTGWVDRKKMMLLEMRDLYVLPEQVLDDFLKTNRHEQVADVAESMR